MTTKKKSTLQPGLVQLSESQLAELRKPIVVQTASNDIPLYPDVGIRYAGYSRELTSSNTYNLYKQVYGWEYAFAQGLAGTFLMTRNVANKAFYCTGVMVNCTAIALATTTTVMSVREEGSGIYYMTIPIFPTWNLDHYIKLDAPFRVSPNARIQLATPVNFGAGEFARIEFFGWYEDK